MGLAKIYDVDPSVNARATNLRAPGFVGTDNDVLIGGIIIGGGPTGNVQRVLIRALGPSLGGAGVAAPWQIQPFHCDTNGNVLANNDNWQDSQQADLAATGMAPPNRKESAILALLAPEITPQS